MAYECMVYMHNLHFLKLLVHETPKPLNRCHYDPVEVRHTRKSVASRVY